MRLIFFAIFFFFALKAGAAQAHPHEWIDMRDVVIMRDGKITGIREAWAFDDYYLALSLPDFDVNQNRKLDPAELISLARKNLENLKDYKYFTFIETDGKTVEISSVEDIGASLKDGRIVMEFTLILAEPVDPRQKAFSYKIYDPSYYIEMKHDKSAGVSFEGDKGLCRFAIDRPKPDNVYVNLAKSLDKNAVAPDDLGKNFAETVSIQCP